MAGSSVTEGRGKKCRDRLLMMRDARTSPKYRPRPRASARQRGAPTLTAQSHPVLESLGCMHDSDRFEQRQGGYNGTRRTRQRIEQCENELRTRAGRKHGRSTMFSVHPQTSTLELAQTVNARPPNISNEAAQRWKVIAMMYPDERTTFGGPQRWKEKNFGNPTPLAINNLTVGNRLTFLQMGR